MNKNNLNRDLYFKRVYDKAIVKQKRKEMLQPILESRIEQINKLEGRTTYSRITEIGPYVEMESVSEILPEVLIYNRIVYDRDDRMLFYEDSNSQTFPFSDHLVIFYEYIL